MPRTFLHHSALWMIAFGFGGSLFAADPTTNASDKAFQKAHQATHSRAFENYFLDEVWAKVGQRSCLNCHHAQGDASDSKFILQDPARAPLGETQQVRRHNLEMFERVALQARRDQSKMLLKALGKLDHGGEEVVKPDSSHFEVLRQFVRYLGGPGVEAADPAILNQNQRPDFLEGVTMMAPERLLRRVTLTLAARLPTAEESHAVKTGGMKSLDALLDPILTEEAFYDRLAEAFNDIFLTRGYDGVPENALSYEHFEKTRHWNQKFDLSHIPEDKRQKARYKLSDDYREAMLREPMELIKYIVRENKPFTELVTADYIMVSPFTARGYGVFEDLKDQFKNPEDPFEYVPVRLKALVGRDKSVQPTKDGFFPHAGILSMFQYLQRYPTTATNRNRLRARMYYQHFLGIDVMELAPRVADAAAVTAAFEVPTMEASDCVVCHTTIDPVAGLFQDYQSKTNDYGPRKEGWFTDMFGPGLEGEALPDDQKWRAIAWLGERTAKDPRFATAMVEHVWYVLSGRKVLLPPQDIDDPNFAGKRRAYRMQRETVEQIAAAFAADGFNLKTVFKSWIATPFYRAEGIHGSEVDPQRSQEWRDLGITRLLSPEQVERKIEAIFGFRWGRLTEQTAILYGGIDSKEITERIADPSGAMGAIQRIMANEIACKSVPVDFTTPPAERRLFPHIEMDVLPQKTPEADMQIRRAIVHLHAHVLGRNDTVDHPEVARTFELFADIVNKAKDRKDPEIRERYACRGRDDKRVEDPHYTLRAWRSVVTYLLRQQDFLYE